MSSTIKTNFFSLWKFVKTIDMPWKIYGVASLLSIIQTVFTLFIPWQGMKIIDNIIQSKAINFQEVLLIIVIFVIQVSAGAYSNYLLTKIGTTVISNLRKKIWKKVLHLKVAFFDAEKTGNVVSKIINDSSILMTVISHQFVNFTTNVIAVIGSVIFLFFIDWQMSLLILAFFPLFFVVIFPFSRSIQRLSRGIQEEMGLLTSHLTETTSAIRLVKSYGAEEIEYSKGSEYFEKVQNQAIQLGKVNAFVNPLIKTVMTISMLTVIGFGVLKLNNHELSAGEFVSFTLYLFGLVNPVVQFSNFFTGVQQAKSAVYRIESLLLEIEEDYNSEVSTDIHFTSMSLNNVSFSYGEIPVLKNVNMKFEKGNIIAIIGASGSGKSTLFMLLQRFYNPTQGTIHVNETNINEFNLNEWRSKVGYVPQESSIRSGTVQENILYGSFYNFGNVEMVKVSQQSDVLSFINDLTQGFNTDIGERGAKLSGGQKQKIAFSRALLRSPDLLLLDEATANLDVFAEKLIQENLNKGSGERITIIIAHRLSTVLNADNIYVLEKGRVIGSGTHEELLKSNQYYQNFVKEQLYLEKSQSESVTV